MEISLLLYRLNVIKNCRHCDFLHSSTMAALSALVISLFMLAIPGSLYIRISRQAASRYVNEGAAIIVHFLAIIDLFFIIASIVSAVMVLRGRATDLRLGKVDLVYLVFQLSRAQLVQWGWRVIVNLGEIFTFIVHPLAILGIFVSGVGSLLGVILVVVKYFSNINALGTMDVLLRSTLQAAAIFLVLMALHYAVYRLQGRAAAKAEAGENEVLTWLEKRQHALFKEFERASRAAP